MDDTPNNAKDPTVQGNAQTSGSPNQNDPDLVTPAIAGEEDTGATTPALESDDDTLKATQMTGAQAEEDEEHPKEVESSNTSPLASSADAIVPDSEEP